VAGYDMRHSSLYASGNSPSATTYRPPSQALSYASIVATFPQSLVDVEPPCLHSLDAKAALHKQGRERIPDATVTIDDGGDRDAPSDGCLGLAE
jgi:hypothetical protein